MGLFSNNGYVPSARDNYMRGLKEQDYLRKRADSQFDAARKFVMASPRSSRRSRRRSSGTRRLSSVGFASPLR